MEKTNKPFGQATNKATIKFWILRAKVRLLAKNKLMFWEGDACWQQANSQISPLSVSSLVLICSLYNKTLLINTGALSSVTCSEVVVGTPEFVASWSEVWVVGKPQAYSLCLKWRQSCGGLCHKPMWNLTLLCVVSIRIALHLISNYLKHIWIELFKIKAETDRMDCKTQNPDPIICCLKKTHFRAKDIYQLKEKEQKKIPV